MEKILYPKWFQNRPRLVLGLFCIIAGLTFPSDSSLFRLVAVAGGIACVIPGFGSLKLDDQGFTYRTLAGTKSWQWTDIDSFFVVTQRALVFIPINRMVGWKFSKTYKKPLILKASSLLVPFDALLPYTYGMTPAELAALLEAWRLRASANQRAA